MKCNNYSFLFVTILLLPLHLFGQLKFESFLFEGYNSPFLDNASSVAISPDEQFLYASSYDDQAISLFARNLNTGALTYVENYKNNIGEITGLAGISQVLVSPDGRHVYACGPDEDAIAVFFRSGITGTLQFSYAAKNSNDGSTPYVGLKGVYRMAFTKDGNYLFAISTISNTLTIFKRNVITGEINTIQQFKDGQNGVNDLTYPIDICLSLDETKLYVLSLGDNAVTAFSRNPVNGILDFDNSNNNIPGLSTAKAIAITPNNKFLFVSGEQGIVALKKNINTGLLTYLASYVDNNFSNAIAAIADMTISSDGNYLITASTTDDAISTFAIHHITGALTPVNTLLNGQGGASGLDYPVALCLTDNANQIYVAGYGSNAIAQLGFNPVNGNLSFLHASNTASFGGLNGMGGTKDVCISPDGNFGYVAGELDDAITIFSRNQENGKLEHLGTIEDGSANDGINGINTILISPGGEHLYATGYWDHSIAIFERTIDSGLLNYLGRVKDNLFGVDGLNGVRDIVITSGGNFLYSAAALENAVGTFSRNISNGMLAFQSVLKDGVLGVDGLSNVSDLVLSPDDKYLYAAAGGEAAIGIFEINESDGQLSYVGVVKNSTPGVTGLAGITAIQVSADGGHLYACSAEDNAIVHFNRSVQTGLLTFVQSYQNITEANGNALLNGASDLALSKDSRFLFVSAESGIVTAFNRDLTTGVLALSTYVVNGVDDINGIGGASSVQLSPDGKFIYVSGADDAAVGIFSCTIFENLEQTICEGESYLFGNELLSTTGVYQRQIESEGCLTITNLTLTVQSINYTLSKTICAGDVVVVAGQSHSNSGVYTYNLTSDLGCDSIVTLNLEVVDQFPVTIIDQSICEGESYEWNGQSLNSIGQFEATLASSFGCDSTVVLNLEVFPEIVTTTTKLSCEGEFYVFGNSNYISSGSYTNTYTGTNGCDSTVHLDLVVVPTTYTQEATICEGDQFELGDQLLDIPGEYVGEVLLNNGCLVEVHLTLHVQPVASSITTVSICQGDYYLFNNAAYWTTGMYLASFPTAGDCDSLAWLDLTVFPTEVYEEVTICEGEAHEIGGQNFSESGHYEIQLTSANGCDSAVVLNLEVIPAVQEITDTFCQGGSYIFGSEEYTEGGTYVQTLLDSMGCTINYTILLEELPVITATANITADAGAGSGSIVIEETLGGQQPYQYDWSNGMTGVVLSNLFIGDYSLTITDANGCFSIFEYTVPNVSNVDALSDLEFSIQVLPNLVAPGGMVYLKMRSGKNQLADLVLINNTGQEQALGQINIGKTEMTFTFEAPQVAGLYFVQLKTSEGMRSLRLSVAY